jgi:hypothetical protein
VTLLLGVAMLGSVNASAQVAKAPGFKIGDGRLHPFLELDARFDSLVGRFTLGVNSPEIVFHFRPGLKFDLETPSTLVNFNGSGEYLWFTGLLSPSSTTLSRFQANVALDAKFNRDGVVEFDVGDSLVRSDRTQNPAFALGVISLYNQLYIAAPIRPGGRALEVTPRVAWGVEFFEPLLPGLVQGCTDVLCDPTQVYRANYSNLNFGANGRWKFLPKTAFILDVNADWRTYFAAPGAQDKVLFRAQAGLAGLITPRISVTLLAGYSGDFTNGSLHAPIGQAEFAYTVNEQSRIAIGYARNTLAVPLVGLATDDRGYLKGGLGLLGGRLLLNAQVSADYFTFVPTVPSPARGDFLLSIGGGPTVIVASWFDVSANYTFSLRTSTVSQLNFPRHEAMLRLNFHY